MIPEESLKVRFIASDPFGGGNLRSFWPAEALRLHGYKARSEMHAPVPRVGEYDVCVIHRPLFLGNLELIRRLRKVGMKIVIDEDDDLSRIHQTKNEIGLREWVPEAVKIHDAAMSIADAVTVSTPQLAEVYRQYNDRVFVCRNGLPRRMLNLPPMPVKGLPRVSWAGITMTHRHDLEWIKPVFGRLMRGAMFSTVGDPLTPQVLRMYGIQREIFTFQSSPESLYRMMGRGDVGIVPLVPNEFNEAKSWLKALEYMTVGVPVVATRLPEQEALITDGVDGFLASTPEEFADRVQDLIRDPELRAEMGRRAKARAAELVVENQVSAWETAIAAAVGAEEVVAS